MPRHESETVSLAEIINLMSDTDVGQWYEMMDIEIEGLSEATEQGESDDFEHADEIESNYIQKHGTDLYHVTWPEHVITPKYNSDANFQEL